MEVSGARGRLRRRLVALLASLALGVAVLLAWFRPTTPTEVGPTATGRVSQADERGSTTPDGGPRPEDHHEDATVRAFHAWTSVAVDSVDGSDVPAYKEVVAGRALVSLSPTIWEWQAGDQVSIAVPQTGHTYSPTLERAETLIGSNRTYSGRLVQGELPYSFVITVGERNVFANLSTPAGQYELVGNTELAWLMPVAGMDQHVDYAQPDYAVRERRDDGP